jgi:hypothetical protein
MPNPIPSLAKLAATADAVEDLPTLVARLKSETAESRWLEWKTGGLFGPDVAVRTKYRAVKAAISFANTDGGFIVFGVRPDGTWEGVPDAQMTHFDPAKVAELVNGIVFPELPAINYAEIREEGRRFVVVHVPSSGVVPHTTTKEITDIDTAGKRVIVVAKHAVYARQGAKSDLASPTYLQRMVERRTIHVRDELVRRVKEVPIAIAGAPGAARASSAGTAVTVARVTTDPSAPAVRVTRAVGASDGLLLHEELSDGLFDEINNVLDANRLLARGGDRFVLGEDIYYRVYAERQHVEPSPANLAVLLKIPFRSSYVPFLFWAAIAAAPLVASEVVAAVHAPKHPFILNCIRLVVLLGAECTAWVQAVFDRRWRRAAQPPQFYWTFRHAIERTNVTDRRLLATRSSAGTAIPLSNGQTVTVGQMLADPDEAATQLSRACLAVFEGNGGLHSSARLLDVAAYGEHVSARGNEIWAEIQRTAGD